MTTTVRCSVCGSIFDSVKKYQEHLPCHGPKIVGASGAKETKEESRSLGGSGSGDN